MGGFHSCCIVISVTGKRFGAAGLKDIIVEADLIGTGSVDATLKGKHYNRAMRILKTVFESLQRLKLNAFESWLLTTERIQILDELKKGMLPTWQMLRGNPLPCSISGIIHRVHPERQHWSNGCLLAKLPGHDRNTAGLCQILSRLLLGVAPSSYGADAKVVLRV